MRVCVCVNTGCQTASCHLAPRRHPSLCYRVGPALTTVDCGMLGPTFYLPF